MSRMRHGIQTVKNDCERTFNGHESTIACLEIDAHSPLKKAARSLLAF